MSVWCYFVAIILLMIKRREQKVDRNNSISCKDWLLSLIGGFDHCVYTICSYNEMEFLGDALDLELDINSILLKILIRIG